MLRANYSDEERDEFFQRKYDEPDRRVRRRFEVLWLHSNGMFAPEIAKIERLNKVTVRKIIKK